MHDEIPTIDGYEASNSLTTKGKKVIIKESLLGVSLNMFII